MTDGLFENKEAWRHLIAGADLLRPSKGKLVKVIEGKRSGQTGRVFWHGRDKYSDAWRYGSPAEWHLRDINGRYGWRVGVKTETGDKFFVNADSVEVIQEQEPQVPPEHENDHVEQPTEEDLIDRTDPCGVPWDGPDPDGEQAYEKYMDAWACRVEANTPPEYR